MEKLYKTLRPRRKKPTWIPEQRTESGMEAELRMQGLRMWSGFIWLRIKLDGWVL
jgi:hypothetical protein